MKTKILTLFIAIALTATTFAHASEPSSLPIPVEQKMGYVSIGTGPLPILLPVFSGGYRFQSGSYGGDFPLQVITLGEATHMKTSALFHYYPKPNLNSQWYFGGGIGPGAYFEKIWSRKWKSGFTFSPELVIGQQYRTKAGNSRFLQAQISIPTIASKKSHIETIKIPLVIVNYGFGF
jgi:hypothetical protein